MNLSKSFRDDLAAARRAFGIDELPRSAGTTAVGGVGGDAVCTTVIFDLSAHAHPIGYTGGGTDREWRFTHTDGSHFVKVDPSPSESYGAWVKDCAEEAERTRSKVILGLDLAAVETGYSIGASHVHVGGTTAATTSAPEWASRSAKDILAEISTLKAEVVKQHDEHRATISFGGRRFGKSWLIGDWLAREEFKTMWVEESAECSQNAWELLKPKALRADTAKHYADRSAFGDFVGHIRTSDAPGIAAMAAKNVQPKPEPVLSVGGEQVTERELAQALALLRGQNAPAVKETPRGLMCVRDFDHRLGAWNEA